MSGTGDRLAPGRMPASAAAARMAPNRPAGGRLLRLVVADASPVFRRGLHSILAHEPDLRVVAEAGSAAEAVAAARNLAPDVVLVEAALAADAQWAGVRELLPRLRLCLLIADGPGEEDLVSGCLRRMSTHADGYLAKSVPVDELAPAMRAVHAGRPVLSPSLAVFLMPVLGSLGNGGTVAVAPSGPAPRPAETGALTERELEVLRLLAEGLPNRRVAARLFISENTVRNHVRHILDKLHLRSRTEAALYAVRTGVIELPQTPVVSRRL